MTGGNGVNKWLEQRQRWPRICCTFVQSDVSRHLIASMEMEMGMGMGMGMAHPLMTTAVKNR